MPALDGLRGVALLGVLFFHADGALRGGFLGVDLFFVLSGFLITSILLDEQRQTGRIALSAFWVRRARRLFPALLSLLLVIAAYAAFLARPDELENLRGEALSTLGYVANWRAIFAHRSYWQLFQAPSPLEHTWSLSIEEQFYVVWPPVIALLLTRHTRRSVLWLSLVVAALSVTATLAHFNLSDTSRVYLGTDTRAVAIALGAALASLVSKTDELPAKWLVPLDVLGLVTVCLLGVAWWTLTGESAFLYHGGLWLTELGGLVLIFAATQGPRSRVARGLSFAPLRYVGAISYGAYLWHWPIDVIVTAERAHLHGVWLHALHFALTFAIATASFRLLEKPIIARGLPLGRPLYVVPGAIGLVTLLVLVATRPRPEPQAQEATSTTLDSMAQTYEGGPAFRVMFVGDSTATSLAWSLRSLRAPGLVVDGRGRDSCTMLQDTCGPDWAALMSEVKPDVTVLMLGGAFMHGIGADGEWRKACYPEWNRRFEANLALRVPELASATGQVWVVAIPYGLDKWDTPELRAEVDCINQSIRSVAASTPGVEVLDLAQYLCPGGNCQVTLNDTKIRVDGVHYDPKGATRLSRWILDKLLDRAAKGRASR